MVIRVNGPSDQLNIGAMIQNNASASALTKSGAGLLTLSGTNTYTGTTTINGGTLAVSGGSAISTRGGGPGNLPGVTLLLNSNQTIGNLSGGGFSGGNVNVQGNTLTLSDNTNQTFGGSSGSSSGGIVKQGSGIVTLSNLNSFPGTFTINAGTVVFSYGNDGSSGRLRSAPATHLTGE